MRDFIRRLVEKLLGKRPYIPQMPAPHERMVLVLTEQAERRIHRQWACDPYAERKYRYNRYVG
ncbi:MAG: hypothetical protein P4L79_10080 [Legionella sp.]|uniref:hypothetical protein n=1 Tax=Legionella sp. TaxID=459 RepID=UPI00283F7D21|nr:hypothetical protein [Legionella sp.]